MSRLASFRSALLATLVALASIQATPTVAAAQQAAPTDAQRQRARELYGEGQTHFDAGRFAEAETAFEGAYREVPNPVVLLGVASAQERRGAPLDAARTLRRYLRARPDAPDRATIEERIAQLDPQGTTAEEASEQGTIRVVCTPAGAAIAIDGEDTGRTAPADIEVPAGEHTVTLTLEGFQPVSETVTVAAGGMNELALTLAEAAAGEPSGLQGEGDVFGEEGAEEAPAEGEGEGAVEAPAPVDAGPSAGVWVTTAIAAVGLVSGTVFGFLALSAQSDFDAMPTADAADRGETYALIADLSFGVAIASGVTAIVLYAVDRPQPAESAAASRRGSPRRDEGPRLTVAPWAAPTGAGAAARIEF